MAAPNLESSKLLKETMQRYFQSLGDAADDGKKVAWCTSVGPAELLRSFGFEVYFPENHGALLGTTRKAGEYIPMAVKQGYAGDICSYLTSDIGSFLEKKTPLEEHYGLHSVPKPDVLVANTNQCRDVQEWFSFYAGQFNVPLATINPPRYLDEVTKDDLVNIQRQHEALIPVLEAASGRKFDFDSLRETVRLSKEASLLWRKALETAKVAPAPLSFFDGCIHMGPIVVLRGTQEAVDYYQVLLEELESRVARGVGAVENEYCRIYWDGMPIWGKLRSLSNLFHHNNVTIVASTYCNSWILDTLDERNPFESMALAYGEIFINRSEKAKEAMLTRLLDEYHCDGIIFHDARTCPNNSNTRYGIPQRLQSQTHLRTLNIEGDLCDLRFYSEGQTHTKIEAFLEQLIESPEPIQAGGLEV